MNWRVRLCVINFLQLTNKVLFFKWVGIFKDYVSRRKNIVVKRLFSKHLNLLISISVNSHRSSDCITSSLETTSIYDQWLI